MTTYRQLAPAEYPALNRLWQQCFGDTEQEITAFWHAVGDQVRVFAAWDGGKAVSMLCALSAGLVDEAGDLLPAAYLYAVCTAPERRNQGLAAKLTAYAEAALWRQGVAVTALVPANAGLFRFYEKLGYETVFYHREYTVPAKAAPVKLTKVDADGYRSLREMQLYGSFLSYDAPLLHLQEVVSGSAGLYRAETDSLVCCAAVQKEGAILHIKELLPDCPEAASALAAALHCQSAVVRTEGSGTPFGMAKALNGVRLPKTAYLGLAFD